MRFDDFRKRARDQTLSPYEKIGFPDAYRQGKEEAIWRDILGKLRNLESTEKTVLDIGPGCSNLPNMLIELCRRNRHQLILIDCQEMLDHLPDEPFIVKVPGRYPDECRWLFEQYAGKVDVVLCYSVLHHMFGDVDICSFLDLSLGLLAEGGEMLIGDVPNISKRKRFFSSPAGIRYHQRFTGRDDIPEVRFNVPEPGHIDDAVMLSLILRCRLAGFDAYWLPQPDGLPMSNRREDILIRRP